VGGGGWEIGMGMGPERIPFDRPLVAVVVAEVVVRVLDDVEPFAYVDKLFLLLFFLCFLYLTL